MLDRISSNTTKYKHTPCQSLAEFHISDISIPNIITSVAVQRDTDSR